MTDVVAAPGNPGIAAEVRCLPVDLSDPADVAGPGPAEGVDLTVVGPEAPLERGVADLFRLHGRPILGPSRRAARARVLEGVLQALHGPARHSDGPVRRVRGGRRALAAVSDGQFGFPVVIKADGLAAGKGVVVAETAREAEQRRSRRDARPGQFGDGGPRLVIEECLTGPEVSFFVLCDGEPRVALSTAQDHKRIFDDDRGPNTGGMGAFAPSPLVTPELARHS